MITTLLRVVGLLIAVGGLAAGWMGFVAVDEIKGLEGNRDVAITHKGRSGTKEAGEKKIADAEQAVEKKKTERNLWFGAGAGGLVVGLVLALLPSSGKRKVPAAAPAPAPNPEAPGGGGASAGAAEPAPAPKQDAPGP
jgi:hypothetical protein